MSCLNLGKSLLPARKAWRSFTIKLQSKLHKLQRSKAIKKKPPYRKKKASKRTKYRISTEILRASVWSHQPRPQHKRQLIRSPSAVPVQFCRSHAAQKRSAPVYVDELFNEPISKEGEEHLHLPPAAKMIKLTTNQPPAAGGSSLREGGKCSSDRKTSTADEMWESVGLASPMMYGIDERAEEFIARFRAELARGE